MPISRLRAAAALTFAFIAASCGGDGGGSPSFADSVSTADAQEFASAVGGNATQMAQMMDFGNVSIGLVAPAALSRLASKGSLATRPIGGRIVTLPALVDWKAVAANPAGLQASAAEGCTYTARGLQMGGAGFVDANQNGIADDLYLKIECTQTDSTSNPDTTYVTYQVQEQAIKENFASLHGFTASFRTQGRSGDEFGNFEGGSLTGSETLDIRSGSAAHKYKFAYTESGKFDTDVSEFAGATEWNGSFDPSTTIVLGDPLPSGDLSFTGREWWTNSVIPLNLSVSLETTTPLAFDAACQLANSTPPFTAGAVLGKLNNNADQASFTATFTACGTPPTIVINGAFDEPLTSR